MSFLNKRLLAIGLFIVSFLVIAWFVVFEYAASTFQKELDQALARLSQKGYAVSYKSLKMGGNPFSLNATFSEVSLDDPLKQISWKGQELTITVAPWDYKKISLQLPGEQTVSLSDALNFPMKKWTFEGARGSVKITSSGEPREVRVEAEKILTWINIQEHPLVFEGMICKLTNLITPLEAELSFKTNVKGLDLFLHIPARNEILGIEIQGKLSGYKNKTIPLNLAQWRDGGGVMDFSKIAINWPPINADASGTLTFDESMYPLGSFSSNIEGHEALLEYLVEVGLVKKKHARAARFVLDLFSSPNELGGRKLSVPITLQDGVLRVGPAKLFKLPSVDPSF